MVEINLKKLNKAEIMVLEDIVEHPGTSFIDVTRRCAHAYRYSYLYNSLTYLIGNGYVQKEDAGCKMSLYAITKRQNK